MKRLAALVILAACTTSPVPPAGEEPRGSPSPGIELAVVASGPRPEIEPYLLGMRVAVGEVGTVAGRTLHLSLIDRPPPETADSLREALDQTDAAAIFVVGDASAVAENRSDVERDGRPVIVLGGDLYSSRSLFRQTFQTSFPAVWQARVLARYLARDRGDSAALVVYEEGRLAERDAYLAVLREEGLVVADLPLSPGPPPAELRAADVVVYVGSTTSLDTTLGWLTTLDVPPRLSVTNEVLRADIDLPTGTVAPGHYAWAPWADAIDRVHDFRERVGIPVGHEQEGYDAIHVLAEALERTGGRTGEPLIRALERNRPDGPTYSALPIVLGPDDHTLADESWIGLYAVPAPDEDREVPTTPWRPIIRTFTYDGERTIFREEDRTAFFPFWEPNRPSPYYFRSVLGIASRPDDPLH